jgi:hypothetical protein
MNDNLSIKPELTVLSIVYTIPHGPSKGGGIGPVYAYYTRNDGTIDTIQLRHTRRFRSVYAATKYIERHAWHECRKYRCKVACIDISHFNDKCHYDGPGPFYRKPDRSGHDRTKQRELEENAAKYLKLTKRLRKRAMEKKAQEERARRFPHFPGIPWIPLTPDNDRKLTPLPTPLPLTPVDDRKLLPIPTVPPVAPAIPIITPAVPTVTMPFTVGDHPGTDPVITTN